MPSSSMTRVWVRAQISSSRYQSLQERARRETSRLRMAPAGPSPTSAMRVWKASPPLADFGDEGLEGVASVGGGCTVSQVLVENEDVLGCPSQLLGPLRQVLLSG